MSQAKWMTVATLAAGLLFATDVRSASPEPTPTPKYEPGRAAIDVDGARYIVKEAWGGSAFAAVTEDRAEPFRKHHLESVQYEDIGVLVGGDLPKPLATWVTDTLNLKYSRKNGAILGLDMTGKEHSRRTFMNALLTDVVFPELDTTNRDPRYITLKLSPENTHASVATHGVLTTVEPPAARLIRSHSFRMSIEGLDTAGVTRIDPITIRMRVGGMPIKERRAFESQPLGLEFSNIVFYVAESRSEQLAKWHEAFVVTRTGAENKERTGRIEVLGADDRSVVYTLELKGLGITHFTPEPVATDDKSRRVRVVMYADQIQFKPGTMVQ